MDKIMEKAIFFGHSEHINNVYAKETKEKLFDKVLFPWKEKVFVKEDLENFDFSEVNFIFSTWGMISLTEEEIKRYFPKLRCVFYAAGTVQGFARPFLNCGVKVFSAWVANGVPVAEYTTATIILAMKGFFTRMHIPGSGSELDNRWKNQIDCRIPGNYDINLGIVGAGAIGKMVIRNVQKLMEHINIFVFDPFLPDEKALEMGVKKVSLEELFEVSDVISNHLANNAETKGMICGKHFEKMKPHAVFINTGRGAQVVEDDLIEALSIIPTRTAILDVTNPEPPLSESPLYNMRNVFLTPHIAGSLGNEVHRMAEYMYEECILYLEEKETRFEVNMEMLKTMA